MNQPTPSPEYAALIAKIRRKRQAVTVAGIIATLLTLAVCSPMYLSVLDTVLIDYEGLHPIPSILLVLSVMFCSVAVFGLVSTPLVSSMDVECDPAKHLALNIALNKKTNLDSVYAMDLFYLGDFNSAIAYANRLVVSNKPEEVLIGLFYRARCEFCLGNFDALRQSVSQYEAYLPPLHSKTKIRYEKMLKSLYLLIAVAENNKEKIEAFRQVESWNTSRATEGYISFLKGITAYSLGEHQEAIYRLVHVKEFCGKTVLAGIAEQYLSSLQPPKTTAIEE